MRPDTNPDIVWEADKGGWRASLGDYQVAIGISRKEGAPPSHPVFAFASDGPPDCLADLPNNHLPVAVDLAESWLINSNGDMRLRRHPGSRLPGIVWSRGAKGWSATLGGFKACLVEAGGPRGGIIIRGYAGGEFMTENKKPIYYHNNACAIAESWLLRVNGDAKSGEWVYVFVRPDGMIVVGRTTDRHGRGASYYRGCNKKGAPYQRGFKGWHWICRTSDSKDLERRILKSKFLSPVRVDQQEVFDCRLCDVVRVAMVEAYGQVRQGS